MYTARKAKRNETRREKSKIWYRASCDRNHFKVFSRYIKKMVKKGVKPIIFDTETGYRTDIYHEGKFIAAFYDYGAFVNKLRKAEYQVWDSDWENKLKISF